MLMSPLLTVLAFAAAGCTTDYPPTPASCGIRELVQRVTISPPVASDASLPDADRIGVPICPRFEISFAEDGLAKCVLYETLDPEWSPGPCDDLPGRAATDRSPADRVTCAVTQLRAPEGTPPTEPGWYLAPADRPDCSGPGRVAYTADANPRPGSVVELRCGIALTDGTTCE